MMSVLLLSLLQPLVSMSLPMMTLLGYSEQRPLLLFVLLLAGRMMILASLLLLLQQLWFVLLLLLFLIPWQFVTV